MANKDPRVDAYIAKSADFAKPILNHLRKLVHTACPDVEETLKWGMPHFMHGGILCSMASFKNHCAFGFWKAEMRHALKNRDKAGEAMGQFGKITAVSDLPKDKIIIQYIKEAAKLNDAGPKLPTETKSKEKKELNIPKYFTAALRKNKKALAAFENFSYSHKKEYVEWITEAKSDETQKKRLEATVTWMSQGKVRNWKYIKKQT
jgi:uncharacterized protein YdeI (YjbR/CyaY-like superfamily)